MSRLIESKNLEKIKIPVKWIPRSIPFKNELIMMAGKFSEKHHIEVIKLVLEIYEKKEYVDVFGYMMKHIFDEMIHNIKKYNKFSLLQIHYFIKYFKMKKIKVILGVVGSRKCPLPFAVIHGMKDLFDDLLEYRIICDIPLDFAFAFHMCKKYQMSWMESLLKYSPMSRVLLNLDPNEFQIAYTKFCEHNIVESMFKCMFKNINNFQTIKLYGNLKSINNFVHHKMVIKFISQKPNLNIGYFIDDVCKDMDEKEIDSFQNYYQKCQILNKITPLLIPKNDTPIERFQKNKIHDRHLMLKIGEYL